MGAFLKNNFFRMVTGLCGDVAGIEEVVLGVRVMCG